MDVVSDERAIRTIFFFFFACSSMCIMCECNKENVFMFQPQIKKTYSLIYQMRLFICFHNVYT